MTIRKLACTAILAAAFAVTGLWAGGVPAARADPCVAGSLVIDGTGSYQTPGFSCTEGDLIFSNFNYSSTGPTTTLLTPQTGGFFFSGGSMTPLASDSRGITVGYTVARIAASATGGDLINDATLQMTGEIGPDTSDGTASVTALGTSAGLDLFNLGVNASSPPDSLGPITADFAGVAALTVSNTVIATRTSGLVGGGIVDNFTETFSITPAPPIGHGLMAALAIGGLLVSHGLWERKKRFSRSRLPTTA